MKYELTEIDVIITCTQAELDTMDQNETALYGTPNVQAEGEPITQVYIGSQPSWKYDRCLAFAEDLEEDGYLYDNPDGDAYTIRVFRFLQAE